MAYTSVLPVHRLDRSIEYVKDRAKTTKSAGSLEEAIDYALNREKTEQTIFEDAMGCTCENAYVDMVRPRAFHKRRGTGIPSGTEFCRRGGIPGTGTSHWAGTGRAVIERAV